MVFLLSVRRKVSRCKRGGSALDQREGLYTKKWADRLSGRHGNLKMFPLINYLQRKRKTTTNYCNNWDLYLMQQFTGMNIFWKINTKIKWNQYLDTGQDYNQAENHRNIRFFPSHYEGIVEVRLLIKRA